MVKYSNFLVKVYKKYKKTKEKKKVHKKDIVYKGKLVT